MKKTDDQKNLNWSLNLFCINLKIFFCDRIRGNIFKEQIICFFM